MVEDDGGDQSYRVAVGLDDAGDEPSAAGAPWVRQPESSVEPVYGTGTGLLVVTVSDRGRLTPRQQRRISPRAPDRSSLPIRVPSVHLHPRLRRRSWDGLSGRAGSSA
jgi:hypothetical protein